MGYDTVCRTVALTHCAGLCERDILPLRQFSAFLYNPMELHPQTLSSM